MTPASSVVQVAEVQCSVSYILFMWNTKRVDLGQFSPSRLGAHRLPRISYTNRQAADDILDHVRRLGTTLLEDIWPVGGGQTAVCENNGGWLSPAARDATLK